MKLDSNIKKLIRIEYKAFEDFMYDGKTKEERDNLAQFFTPPEVSIKLIEELSDLSGNIIDPTSGSGNLLAAALIAGADGDKIFGNDYEERMVILCRKRLSEIPDRLKKVLESETDDIFKDFAVSKLTEITEQLARFNADRQIHRGNALHEFALTYFEDDYDTLYNANGYRRVNHKNLLHIDDKEYDAYEEPAFKKAHLDLYAEICKERADRTKAKRAEELADVKEQYDDGDLSFLASFGGSNND